MSSSRTVVSPTPASGLQRPAQLAVLPWIALGLLAALVVLGAAAHTTPYFPLDLQAARAVQAIPFPWFHTFMMAVSWIGFPPQAPILAGLVVLGYLVARRWREAGYIAASAIGIAALGQVAKMLVDRPRPPVGLIRVWDPGLNNAGWSFPAGHVQSFMAVVGFIFFLAYAVHGPSLRRTVTLVVTGALIVLIGVSRVDSGDHWLSDVVGGYLIGGMWLVILIYVYRRWSDAASHKGKASAAT